MTKITSTKVWTRIAWPYDDQEPHASWECWQLGRIILCPPDANGTHYVAAFGANSERSHSGFLPAICNLVGAKAEIERRLAIGAFN